MKNRGRQPLMLAASCLVCLLIALRNAIGLAGTEFSGGALTGPLLSMTDVGTVLFVLALVGSFVSQRISGMMALASCLLCLPLYLFLIAPIPFNRIFGDHELKVRPSGGLQGDAWAITGILSLALTTYICVRSFALTYPEQS